MLELTFDIPGVNILRLNEKHIDEVIALMNKEGWYYYDHHELKRYLVLNQECFTLSKDGRIVGSLFTTSFGNQAWLGNIIVAKDVRGMGLATELIKAVTDYLYEKKHIGTFRLGAVPLAIGLYKKVGFHAETFTTAQEVELPLNMDYEKMNLGGNVQVERLQAHDLESIGEMDERYFKSKRIGLLQKIYDDSIKESCFCLKSRNKMVGFLMVRRRQASKNEENFAEGPDYAYRLGPSCVSPEYGIDGFKVLFRKAIRAVNEEVQTLKSSAKMYAVFPKNADKNEIYEETRALAAAMGMDSGTDPDRIFDEHDFIFGTRKSTKNKEQWDYMKILGFHQEYFEQVMSYIPGEPYDERKARKKADETKADMEGIFASATPGDKA